MSRVLLIDNYDSFTFNLAQALRVLGAEVLVYRNDKIDVAAALALAPTHLVISPGPGRPEDAGISMQMVEAAMGAGIPVLGVCLGHQAIGAVLGGTVGRAPQLMHGKSSMVSHDGQGLYAGLSNPFEAARYHSLVVERETLPACLEESAWLLDEAGRPAEIMGLRHRSLPVEGVQFHPESILTPAGRSLLRNFLQLGA